MAKNKTPPLTHEPSFTQTESPAHSGYGNQNGAQGQLLRLASHGNNKISIVSLEYYGQLQRASKQLSPYLYILICSENFLITPLARGLGSNRVGKI